MSVLGDLSDLDFLHDAKLVGLSHVGSRVLLILVTSTGRKCLKIKGVRELAITDYLTSNVIFEINVIDLKDEKVIKYYDEAMHKLLSSHGIIDSVSNNDIVLGLWSSYGVSMILIGPNLSFSVTEMN